MQLKTIVKKGLLLILCLCLGLSASSQGRMDSVTTEATNTPLEDPSLELALVDIHVAKDGSYTERIRRLKTPSKREITSIQTLSY